MEKETPLLKAETGTAVELTSPGPLPSSSESDPNAASQPANEVHVDIKDEKDELLGEERKQEKAKDNKPVDADAPNASFKSLFR